MTYRSSRLILSHSLVFSIVFVSYACSVSNENETGLGLSGAGDGETPTGQGEGLENSMPEEGTAGAESNEAEEGEGEESQGEESGAEENEGGETETAEGDAENPECVIYASNFDDPNEAIQWKEQNDPVGTQWGQFSEHWDWGNPIDGPGSDHTGNGGNLWANALNDNYYYFESSYLESPVFDLSEQEGAVLRYWQWLELDWCESGCGAGNPEPTSLDGARVECWDGTSWAEIAPEGGYPGTIRTWDSAISPAHPLKDVSGFKYDPTSALYDAQWREITMEFPGACLHSESKVRFRFGADSGASSSNGQGWYIDDLEVEDCG